MSVVGAAYRLRYGYDLHDTNPIGALKNNEVPLCLIHGSDNDLIAPSNSGKLRDATKGYVELHLVDGVRHAGSRELLDEDAYIEIIAAFLKKALHWSCDNEGNIHAD
ncbi:alpha/beta fold hydrolase [Olegusella massiliensis]|uniref:alpha/beta fold hydrolase n=1 Tax=Olegusella massiliensis TaxID=1776381 RepID=UPI0023F87A66|nr:alpha/beta hydrolase [Olegusella massiliensis]MBS5864754.1 alpha/beta hydrolase [Coriobacteriaceae bacterium]